MSVELSRNRDDSLQAHWIMIYKYIHIHCRPTCRWKQLCPKRADGTTNSTRAREVGEDVGTNWEVVAHRDVWLRRWPGVVAEQWTHTHNLWRWLKVTPWEWASCAGNKQGWYIPLCRNPHHKEIGVHQHLPNDETQRMRVVEYHIVFCLCHSDLNNTNNGVQWEESGHSENKWCQLRSSAFLSNTMVNWKLDIRLW